MWYKTVTINTLHIYLLVVIISSFLDMYKPMIPNQDDSMEMNLALKNTHTDL
jgi:hypothetical protein